MCFRVSIKFNINHSVSEEETEGSEKVILRSKPDFEIDITRDDVILGFNCSFISQFEDTELDESNGIYIDKNISFRISYGYDYFTDDVFHIDEVTIYKNKYSDNKYALAGDTLDAVR